MSRAWVLALAWGAFAGCSGNDFQQDDANAGEAGELGAGRGGSSSAGEGGEASGGAQAAAGGTGGKGVDADDGGEAGSPSGGTGGKQTGSGDTGGAGAGGSDPTAGESGAPSAGVGGAGHAGMLGIGGDPATGGTGGLLGASGSPPVGGMGGTSSGCSTTLAMDDDGFVTIPAKGGVCWHGYAFAGGDASSTVTFPGGGTDFSRANGALAISGTVGAATEANGYAGNVYLGMNLGQELDDTISTIVPSGTSITVTCIGCATPAMRVSLVAGTTQWCAPPVSGAAIPYTSFKKECWEGGAMTAYAGEAIESIQISIPGAATEASFDLTITGVAEN